MDGTINMELLIDNFENKSAYWAMSALEIKVLIAFLTEDGLNWLPDDRAPFAEFIFGIDLGITSPKALKKLQQQGASVMIFSEPDRMFHPPAAAGLQTEPLCGMVSHRPQPEFMLPSIWHNNC